MKFYSGTYDKNCVMSNALVTNLLKYPEIGSALISLYPQYSATAYILDGFGRFAKEDMMGDVKFQWAVQGRLNRPSTLTGTNVGAGLANAAFFVEFEENYFNPNDTIKFADGNIAIIIGEPVASAGGYTYQMKLQTTDAAAFVATTALAVGISVGKVSTAFTEKSERGFENHAYPDWYVNYIGTSRKACSISGSAITDVTWIEAGGQRLWYFTAEQQCRMEFLYELEKNTWYGQTTMDVNGNSVVTDMNGLPIVQGDGILRQIDSSNVDTFSGNLSESILTDFLGQLQLNTGNTKEEWVVFTGTRGRINFHEAMKDYIVSTGNYMWHPVYGKEIGIGSNFTQYSALGSRITLIQNWIFDDPNLNGNNINPATGLPFESERMVFMNIGSTTDGVSNVERKTKGAGGINRSMITRYIPGMVNPMDPSSMMAATPRDSFDVEYMSESGIVIRNPLSCGMLIKA